MSGDLGIAWTDPALASLTEIVTYIAIDDPQAAVRLRDRILAVIERAAAHPHSGRIVPELARQVVREVIVRPYRIVYRVAATHIVIWAVHSRVPDPVGGSDRRPTRVITLAAIHRRSTRRRPAPEHQSGAGEAGWSGSGGRA